MLDSTIYEKLSVSLKSKVTHINKVPVYSREQLINEINNSSSINDLIKIDKAFKKLIRYQLND
ncbi:hypothetical protein [Vibrio marisflavi]|uniref:Uncharacterized protein n=1 Tax=Vibrio marisflavi CECT 7928 TaxID=634439 RepID=A0ABM8ZYL9_9VIBR|nr:hypothetical protein [Vibrio marisflavi]CAH0535998.1 hypothetical protein VMF7928_00093 [Vibrio marisflavi CECT 7928]